MNYETASDFDLSMAVAKLAHPSNKNIQDWGGEVSIASGGDGRGGYWVTYFDINNPADMWPIIERIFQTLSTVSKFDDGIGFGEREMTLWQANMSIYKCSQLRAAAIVYLKMMEQK